MEPPAPSGSAASTPDNGQAVAPHCGSFRKASASAAERPHGDETNPRAAHRDAPSADRASVTKQHCRAFDVVNKIEREGERL